MNEQIKEYLYQQLLNSTNDKNTVKDLYDAIQKVTDFFNNTGRIPAFITINDQILSVCS